MDTQPKIPTLKDSQKPQVKVRGLQAGATLLERLKQFKKKDLAFILAGLGTLFMAPLAEHFMMSPESGDGSLQQGWGKGGGKGLFDGSGSSPYEPGTSGMAPGSAIGGGSDIITPLNVRDPSALIMGPGATQQPPTNSVMPSTPPPTAPPSHSDSDLKDALAASARGANAGVKAAKALLPIPKIALAGSGGLRGLGVVNGGSTASAGGSAPSSAGLVGNRAAGSNSLGSVRAAPGYKGVARGQSAGDGTNTIDALRKAADNAAGAFNRGAASTALNTAANTAIPTGSGGALGGGGAGGSGSTDKANGGNQSKDGKTVGESLAFLKAKQMQEAQIALWTKEQEAGDSRLELLKMRNSMAESIAGSIGTAVGTYITCPLTAGNTVKSCFSTSGDKPYICVTAGGQGVSIPASEVAKDPSTACSSPASGSKTATPASYFTCGSNNGLCMCNSPTTPIYTGCSQGGVPTKTDDKTQDPNNSISSMPGVKDDDVDGLKSGCDNLLSISNQSGFPPDAKTQIQQFVSQAGKFVQVREASKTTGGTSGDCSNNGAALSVKAPLWKQVNDIVGANMPLLNTQNGVIKTMDDLTNPKNSNDPNSPLLGQIGAAVNGGDNKIAANIATFYTDVQTVDSALAQAKTGLVQPTADGLQSKMTIHGSNAFTPDQLNTMVTGVMSQVKKVNDGAAAVSKMVDNFDKAEKALGNPQDQNDQTTAASLLMGSVGTDANGTAGSVGQLVIKVNSPMDLVGGSSQDMNKVVAPLVAPKLDHQDGDPSPASGITPATVIKELSQANAAVMKADTAVKTYLGPPVVASALDAANTALQPVGPLVRGVDADQVAVDAALKSKVIEAATAVGLGNKPSSQQ